MFASKIFTAGWIQKTDSIVRSKHMNNQNICIADLMETSGVGFGTSGARGLVKSLTDQICYLYTLGFLTYLKRENRMGSAGKVAVAGDLRGSTPRIMRAVVKAIEDFESTPLNCGYIPSPAVALFGIEQGIPSIMVTGSHIPDDRNGIKFNQPSGEILKQDEAGIRQQSVVIPAGLFDQQGNFIKSLSLPEVDNSASTAYFSRYLDLFPQNALSGRRIGLYQHSGVARELLGDILAALGAEVVKLGYSDHFIPVDTEAIRDEDIESARKWSKELGLDAIVSTDGDADRPLISDEQGNWLRGDIAGLLCARYLNAGSVVTPVSSNTVVEKTGWFERVIRTRIGSPFVIESMNELLLQERRGGAVVGYEANGGFLLGSGAQLNGQTLIPLPTRDAVIVILSILVWSTKKALPISALINQLPARFTFSDRLKNVPIVMGKQFIASLAKKSESGEFPELKQIFATQLGSVKSVDTMDGLRVTFESDDIVHLRMSGNAPELRCYTESTSQERARELNKLVIRTVQRSI